MLHIIEYNAVIFQMAIYTKFRTSLKCSSLILFKYNTKVSSTCLVFSVYLLIAPALVFMLILGYIKVSVQAERGLGIGESEGTWNCGEGTVEMFG